uniref:SFRICE_007398 n=1 Tax=Spodoptera frugiperda TaxID=7108 RepID=A0A2H1VQI4_SPOFR
MDTLKWLSDLFWDERWWLPRGAKWADVTNGPDKTVLHPDVSDFYYVIPLTIGLLVLRYVLNIYCFIPLGLALGIRNKKKKNLQHIPVLETAYRKNALIKDTTALAKQLDMSERQVERWWRLRRNQDKTSSLTKFCEHAWKTFYLFFSTPTVYYIVWDKDWFWDLDKCYTNYGKHELTMDIYWFYLTTMAYMIALSITFFHDVKRKDFWGMLAHHVVTILLLCISWIISAFRIGIVVIVLLDLTETWLEFVKALKRANFEKLATSLFVAFVPAWFYTRMYLFPLYLYSTSIRSMVFWGHVFALYIVNAMLFVLFFLCVYWSVLIVKVVFDTLKSGVPRDVRSSSSEVSEAEVDKLLLQTIDKKNALNKSL